MGKKIVFVAASPRGGGNGDALITAAMEAAREKGAEVFDVKLRDMKIACCNACYACRESGVCIQKDDFAGLLALLHDAQAVIVTSPVYYNCMSAQLLTAINRLCCTFACKTYSIGPKKKVGIMLTCTGSDVEEMKHHIRLITTLPSIRRSIEEDRVEIFTKCTQVTTCQERQDYMEKAALIGAWAAE